MKASKEGGAIHPLFYVDTFLNLCYMIVVIETFKTYTEVMGYLDLAKHVYSVVKEDYIATISFIEEDELMYKVVIVVYGRTRKENQKNRL